MFSQRFFSLSPPTHIFLPSCEPTYEELKPVKVPKELHQKIQEIARRERRFVSFYYEKALQELIDDFNNNETKNQGGKNEKAK
jgi:hypothetical protein